MFRVTVRVLSGLGFVVAGFRGSIASNAHPTFQVPVLLPSIRPAAVKLVKL